MGIMLYELHPEWCCITFNLKLHLHFCFCQYSFRNGHKKRHRFSIPMACRYREKLPFFFGSGMFSVFVPDHPNHMSEFLMLLNLLSIPELHIPKYLRIFFSIFFVLSIILYMIRCLFRHIQVPLYPYFHQHQHEYLPCVLHL